MQGARGRGCVQGDLCEALNAGCYVQELCIRYLGTDAAGCYVESVVCRVLDTGPVYSVPCCVAE